MPSHLRRDLVPVVTREICDFDEWGYDQVRTDCRIEVRACAETKPGLERHLHHLLWAPHLPLTADAPAAIRISFSDVAMRSVRAFLVLGAFFAFTFPLMPLQLLLLRTGSRYARTFPALVSSASVQDRRHPPQRRRRGRRGARRAPDLEPCLLARHHRALGGGAGVVRGQARSRVLAVRELARQAATLGVR